MPLATGQITIIDLTDLPSLQGYLTSSFAKTQFLSTTNVYNPDWSTAPNLLISAELYAVGTGSNLIEDARVTAITWFKNGTEITVTGGGITLVPTATGNLKNTSIKIDQNLLTGAEPTLKIGCTIMYKHASTVDATPVKIDIDYALAQQGATGGGGATGISALSVIVSNESCSLPANSAGAVSSYANSGTIIRLFEGTTELDYDAIGTANGKWKVVAAGTSIVPGSVSISGLTAVVGNHSAMTASSAKIVYTITGKRANGTAISITKEQSFTRNNAGVDALAIDLSGSQIFSYNETGSVVTPASITVTSARKNIASTTYTWTYGLNGAAPTTALNTTNFPGVTFGADTVTITAASSGWGSAKSMTIKALNSGASDTFTISKVQDGAFAYLLTLEATANTMTFDYLGAAKPAGQAITFTAVNNNIPDALGFTAESVNAAGTVTAFAGLTGTGNTRSLAIASWPVGAVRIKVTATAGSYSDSMTIIRIQDAADSFAGYLTNESITLPAENNGAVIGTLATLTAGTFNTFLGTTALASGVAYALVSNTDCAATINSTTGAYSVTTFANDKRSGSAVFRATHSVSGAIITKTLTLSKSIKGNIGPDGIDAVNLVLWAPGGEVFKRVGGAVASNLSIQADLYKGGVLQTTGITYAWYIQGAGWEIINATTPHGCTGYTTGTLTVPPSSVPSLENFKCVATYLSKTYSNSLTLIDMTDSHQVVVQSTGGTTFFNGGGSNKTLRAAVYQNGEEIQDDATPAFNYSWSKYVGGVLQGAAGSAGTTKSITVTAASIISEATYICDVSYK